MNDIDRYTAAAHAMQSGVAMELERGSDSASPKHLRVGINSALVDDAALVRLLVAKGIITHEEFMKELADEMEREKARYEERLSAQLGSSIKLA